MTNLETFYPVAKPLVDNVLIAMAHAELQREKVDAIYNEILANGVWLDETGTQILESSRAWRIADEKRAADYYRLCDLALREAGYTLPDVGYCPALIAEDERRKAESVMVDTVAPLFGITHDMLMRDFDKYKRFIDLVIKTVVSHPDYKSPLERK